MIEEARGETDVRASGPNALAARAAPPASHDRGLLVEHVFSWLTGAITQGQLGPGQQLRETVLASKLGVSRTPVREAMQLLVNEGLAEVTPTGTRVAELTVKEVEDLFLTAEVLNGLACRLAVIRGDDRALESLDQELAQVEEAALGDDLSRWTIAHNRLHEHILQMAENRSLSRSLGRLSAQMARVRHLDVHQPRRLAESTREHRRIVEAIKARDPEAAEQTSRAHSRESEAIVVGLLRTVVVPFKGERF